MMQPQQVPTSSSAVQSADESTDGWQLKIGYRKVPVLPFTVSNTGPQRVCATESELEYFKLFFTDTLLADITAETNRYAKSKLDCVTLRPNSIWRTWTYVSVEELQAYLGVVLNMAVNDKYDVKHYFSHNWLDYMPFFGSVFSHTRFLQIHWMLHVSPPPRTSDAAPSSDATPTPNKRGD